MADFPRITRNPEIMGGKPCIRDTHVTVSVVIALLSSGRSKEEVIQLLPALNLEDLKEVLAYAAWLVDNPEAAQTAASDAPVDLAGSKPTFSRIGPPSWPGKKTLPQPGAPEPVKVTNHPSAVETPVNGTAAKEQADVMNGAETQEMDEAEGEPAEGAMNVAQQDESLELYHPAYPDAPTVTVTRHGLFDRRWATNVLAWSDIEEIERISGQKNINIVLRNPEHYLSSMPFLKRFCAQIKLALNMQIFYLDTASLGIRTKDLYFTANRLWQKHRGKVRFHKKRRIKVGKRSSRDSYWQKCLPM